MYILQTISYKISSVDNIISHYKVWLSIIYSVNIIVNGAWDSHPCTKVKFNGRTSTSKASDLLSLICLSNSLDCSAIAGHINFVGVMENYRSKIHELNLSNIGNPITTKLLTILELHEMGSKRLDPLWLLLMVFHLFLI